MMKKSTYTFILFGLFLMITSSVHAASFNFSGEVELSDDPLIGIGTQFDGVFSYNVNAVATHTEYRPGKMGTGENRWAEYGGALKNFEVSYHTAGGLKILSLSNPGTITVGKLYSLVTKPDLVTIPETNHQVFRVTGALDTADFTLEFINGVHFGTPPDLNLPTFLNWADFDYCRLALTDKNLGTITVNGAIKELNAVPIPATLWLFGFGLMGLAGSKRKYGLKNRAKGD